MAAGGSDVDGGTRGAMDWKTLCFYDLETERGFLEGRKASLPSNTFWLFFCTEIYAGCFLISLSPDWSTAGGRFVSQGWVDPVSHVYTGAVFAINIVLISGIVLSRLQRVCQIVSVRCYEVLVLCHLLLMVPLLVISHAWYTARLVHFGSDARSIVVVVDNNDVDASLVLLLDGVVTTSHLLLPMRWAILLPLQIVPVILYLLCVVVLGSPSPPLQVVFKLMFLVVLLFACCRGKRSMETHQREAFLRLVVERERRVTMERKLDEVEQRIVCSRCRGQPGLPAPRPGLHGPLHDDTASCASVGAKSNTTSIMFTHPPEAAPEDRLTGIRTLGFNEHWLIRWDDVRPQPDCIIGVGGFGFVMKASYHGADVVMKAPLVPQGGDGRSKDSVAALVHELRMLRKLRHPNIVVFYGCCVVPEVQDLLIVLEYVRGLPLQRFLAAEDLDDVSWGPGTRGVATVAPTPTRELRRKIASDVCSALRYLHAQVPCVVHGDIKDRNTLVECAADQSVNAKLVDFGLSRVMHRHARPLGGTANWMAPEVLRPDGALPAPSADVYSFGCLLYLIATSRRPWEPRGAAPPAPGKPKVAQLDLDWDGEALAEEFRPVCEACCRLQPKERPTMLEAHLRLTSLIMRCRRKRAPSPDAEGSFEDASAGTTGHDDDSFATLQFHGKPESSRQGAAALLAQARVSANTLLAEEAHVRLACLLEGVERPPQTSSQRPPMSSGVYSLPEEVSFGDGQWNEALGQVVRMQWPAEAAVKTRAQAAAQLSASLSFQSAMEKVKTKAARTSMPKVSL